MKQKNKIHALKIIILLSLYYALLLWVYEYLLSNRWSYVGLVNESNESSRSLSIFGFVFTLFTYIIIDKNNKPSALVMNLFNLLFFIPMYVFIAHKQTVGGFYLFLFFYQLILFLFYRFMSVSFKPLIYRSKNLFFIIIGFTLVATLFINGYYNGFQIKIDLSDVYENRLAVRDMSIPSILRYIKSASYLIGVIALMFALKAHNWTISILIILLQLMSFAFGASKMQFFSIFVCLIVFFLYSNRMRFWMPISLIFIIVCSIMEYKIFNTTEIVDIGIRRSLFVPPKISYTMFEFFETPGREFLYLRSSLFKFFGFEDPYAAYNGFQRLIGSMSGSEDTNANTGLLGNDYAQFGWWALLVFPFLRVYFLRLYDYCAVGIDNRIIVVISIFMAYIFISSAFFSTFMTNGFLITLYLLYCYPKEYNKYAD